MKIGQINVVCSVVPQVWLGADEHQTRISECYMEKMHLKDLEATLEPIFYFYSQASKPTESFGDFCSRVGFDALREYSSTYIPVDEVEQLPQVGVTQGTFEKLKALAEAQSRTLEHVTSEALEKFLGTS